MAKPMLVTLPLVLLLLDYWPLNRVGNQTAEVRNRRGGVSGQRSVVRGLVREKIPLLVLSAGSSIITLFVQRNAASFIESLPLLLRIWYLLFSYDAFFWKIICQIQFSTVY